MDVNVIGEIIPNDDKRFYDWYEYDSFCPNDLKDALAEANGEDVILHVNSPGGDVISASDIRSMLKEYQGKTKAIITGNAASAASVIVTGADVVAAHVTALYMVHQASTYVWGNSDDMQKTKNMLDEVNRSIANAYADKTGMTVDEALQLMKDESWLSVQSAKEKGFIDEIISDSGQFSYAITNSIKPRISDKMRNLALSAKSGKLFATSVTVNEEMVEKIVNKRLEAIKNEQLENQKQDLLKDLSSFGK